VCTRPPWRLSVGQGVPLAGQLYCPGLLLDDNATCVWGAASSDACFSSTNPRELTLAEGSSSIER